MCLFYWNAPSVQVVFSSLELAREVQRITVDASANISEVQQITVASMDPSTLSGSFAVRHGYYLSPTVPFNATEDEVRGIPQHTLLAVSQGQFGHFHQSSNGRE